MEFSNLIARHLGIKVFQIVKISELAQVWCVVVLGRRPTFVSKRKVLSQIKVLSPITWRLEAKTRRQEGKKWVSRIDGLDKSGNYEFARTFIGAKSTEWGKCGIKKAEFEISEIGFYQDSDGDYFKAFINADSELDCEICSKLEVQAAFGLVKV